MPAIARDSLLTLEAYAKERSAFRARVLAHKRNRIVHLGPHVTLLFEDELTIRYQIQEMLRIEKTFDESGIQQEVDAYNPLVPDGSNLKATMLLEYEDADARHAALAQLRGIEDHVFMRVAGFPVVRAVADEDLYRQNNDKKSDMHFVRLELTPAMIAAFKAATPVALSVDHPNYQAEVAMISPLVQETLASDFT